MKVRKAIITAAGVGTRFLPATKCIQKELIPVINKPALQYVVEQCVEAGIEEIIIVTRKDDTSVEKYFSPDKKLENYLIERGKSGLAKKLQEICSLAKFTFVKQDTNIPYGNASPLYSARKLIGNEPFIYSWGDDIVVGEDAGVKEVIKMYGETNADIVLNCVKTTPKRITSLGAIEYKTKETVGKNGTQISRIVEKPPLNKIPSCIASVSPYLFTPVLFKYLDPNKISAGEEFIIQDAINEVAKTGKVVANITSGTFCTTGDPLSYLITTTEVGLRSKEFKEEFSKYLHDRLKKLDSQNY